MCRPIIPAWVYGHGGPSVLTSSADSESFDHTQTNEITKSLKKTKLREGKATHSTRDKWRAMVSEIFWEVVSVLTTCRKGSNVEMREEREATEGLHCINFSLYFLVSFFKMKYIENGKSKLSTVFIFETIRSRSSKLTRSHVDRFRHFFLYFQY
jgi:hypothetical protein